jgi:transcriptional regulator with XRE-family HTH domain
MTMKKKILVADDMPEFQQTVDSMPAENRIFVDRSLEIADYIHYLMDQAGLKQKDLAEKLGKSEAEVSKWLGGMHNYTLRSLSKLEAALSCPIVVTPKQRHYHVPPTMVRRHVVETQECLVKYDTFERPLQRARIIKLNSCQEKAQLQKAI